MAATKVDTIGHRIKILREMRGISQSELSRRIDVTPQAIQSLESDNNPNRKTKHVLGIAAALDFDPRYLDLQTSFDQFEAQVKEPSPPARPAAIAACVQGLLVHDYLGGLLYEHLPAEFATASRATLCISDRLAAF